MAVNLADGFLFVSVLFYPISAAKAAASVGAGWFSILFVPLGLATGFAVTFVARKILYLTMEYVLRHTNTQKGWIQAVVGAPLLLGYMVFPFVVIAGGLYATWFGTIWVVRWFY